MCILPPTIVGLGLTQQVDHPQGVRSASLLTRDEVALAVGCSTRAIYRWESGDREPRGLYATRYGNVLDLLARDLARQATKAMSSEVRIAS
ncbi:MAG: XRE family transcriptional regulator [Lysobacteraceae bacterium]|nr:MAG: XRE family transcriptional regulator [Xanthomonadaceae bacterium]